MVYQKKRAWKKRTEFSPLKLKPAFRPGPAGHTNFFVLESGDWVNVLPITPSGQVLLVRQYRHGTKEVTLEIPGGLVDPGQTPEQAGARELLEETGYTCSELKLLGRVRPNPAILDNWCYSYLAEGVEKVAEKELDEAEDLELVRVDLSEFSDMIARGEIDHSLVLCAYLFYRNNGG